METDPIESIIEALAELQEDNSVPKNVKSKIIATIAALKENTEISIKVNKALNELDEIAEDANMQPYTRTQIWNALFSMTAIQGKMSTMSSSGFRLTRAT